MAAETEPGVLPEEPSSPPGLDPLEVLGIIWAKRKIILILSFGVSLLTLGILFLQPNYYKAVSTILPETQENKLSSLGQFADVAQLAGVSIPGSEIARLYPIIITSESVLRNVIYREYQTKKFSQPVNLVKFWDIEKKDPVAEFDAAYRRLKQATNADFDLKTSMVTVTLDMTEPQLAADVLNRMVAELDDFMRTKRTTNAEEQRKWVEVRLKEVAEELRNAEERLKEFREKNRRVSDSPELLLQQDRLARDVEINSTVFIELKKQLELAKIEEIKNTSIINILDVARPPTVKDRPKRATNTATMFLLVFIGSSAYFVIRQKYWSHVSGFIGGVRRGKR
jgi:uncharacterized protein involved in exopolysaccharide biosynthesis